MYLPIWMLSFAVVLIVVGIAVGIYTIFKFSVVALVVAIAAVVLGVGALLCWKNQNIVILSGDLFEYTTFLGKKTTYRFSEIKGIRKNKDSLVRNWQNELMSNWTVLILMLDCSIILSIDRVFLCKFIYRRHIYYGQD